MQRPPEATDPYPAAGRVSAWAFLARKYDRDADGRITPEEHGRGEAAFANLDGNEDGAITQDDVAHGPIHGLVAQMTVMRYFQADEGPLELTREEVLAGFARYDANGDTRISEAEFVAAAAVYDESARSPIPKMVGGMNPLRSIVLEADLDGNDTLSRGELVTWIERRADDEGVWAMKAPRRPKGAKPRPSGPAAGTAAPDFTLTSPDGSQAVTLSAFQGKKPVALIFGSYT